MDQQKTGRFIAALRREKGWTQTQLADRLGVTDKAVSRWETGKGMPDVSLLSPLGEALEVSVNELLAGERSEPERLLEQSDALVLRTLEESRQRLRKFRQNLLYAAGGVLLGGSLLFLGFDTSFVAVYASLLGALLLAAAAWLQCQGKRRGLLAAGLVLLLALGLFELRDFVFVTFYELPPQYSLQIVTGQGEIRYEKLFYDVIRSRPEGGEECYQIAAKQRGQAPVR